MKNKKCKIYVIIEILTFACMMLLIIFSSMRLNGNHMAESGMLDIEEVIYLVLELVTGNLILIICIHMQARSINEKLCLETRRLRAIVDSSFSLIFEYDIRTNEFKWYGDVDKIFNVAQRDTKLESFLHPDDWPIILQQFEDAKRSITYSVEVKLRDARGEYRICNCQTIIEKNITGGVTIILGMIQDVDVRQNSETCAS